MVLARSTAVLLSAFCVGCTPSDFPENPFVATEQDLVAPDIVPLQTGFPGEADLAEAREAEEEVFALSDEADALRARTEALGGRDPALSGDQTAPDTSAENALARGETLRARAAELRAREDVGQVEDAAEIDARREEIDTQSEILRGRTD